ncbi:hypothetical protein SK128_000103, partial [Halocaridina rubra]
MTPLPKTKAQKKGTPQRQASYTPSQNLFATQNPMEYVSSPLDIETEGPPRTPGSTIMLHTPTKVDVFAGHPSDMDVEEEEEGDHVVQPTTQEEEQETQEQQQQQPGDESELDLSRPGSSHEDPSQYRFTGRETIVFSPRQEAELVEWLQQHPYLYDKGLVLYRDKERKKRAFQGKGATLVPPVSGKELEKWFPSRRKPFGRITRKIMTIGAGQPHLTLREKFVLKHFEFLRPHIARHRDTQVLGTPEAGVAAAAATGGASLHASTIDVGEGVAGPSGLGGGPSLSSMHRRTSTVSRGSQTEEDEENEDEVEEVARVEHTTRPKRKRKPDRPSSASTSSAAGPKEQEEIGRTLTGMGNVTDVQLRQDCGQHLDHVGGGRQTNPVLAHHPHRAHRQVLGMSVDVDKYGEVNRAMHE